MTGRPHLTIVLLVIFQHVLSSWAQSLESSSSTFNLSSPSSTMMSTSSSVNSSSTLSASLTSSAQFPSLSGYSSCVSNCLAVGIARVNCSSVIDVNCFCFNPGFPREVVGCIESECPTELSTEEDLSQRFCNVASSSPKLSFPTIASTSSTTSSVISSPTSTISSATATKSSTATQDFRTLPQILGISIIANVLIFALSAYTIWC